QEDQGAEASSRGGHLGLAAGGGSDGGQPRRRQPCLEGAGENVGAEVPSTEEDLRRQQVPQQETPAVDVREKGAVPDRDHHEGGWRAGLQASEDPLGGGTSSCLPRPLPPPEQGLRTPNFLQRDLGSAQCHPADGAPAEAGSEKATSVIQISWKRQEN